jgi:hypothetical protein
MGIYDRKSVKEEMSVEARRAKKAVRNSQAAFENLMRVYEASVDAVWTSTKVAVNKRAGLKNDGTDKVVGAKEVIDALGNDAVDVLNLQKDLGDMLAKYDAEKVNAIRAKVGPYSLAQGRIVLG